jgi:hypothetical protein
MIINHASKLSTGPRVVVSLNLLRIQNMMMMNDDDFSTWLIRKVFVGYGLLQRWPNSARIAAPSS